VFGVSKEEKQELERKYLGKNVRVEINDPYHYICREGVVLHIDDAGQLHGTWGSLAAIPGEDSINIIK
jgi:hypothetical protein